MNKLDALNVGPILTVRDRCRVCYTCVRECPAKAICIYEGQAEVIKERCINCGNCIKVCSQNAKTYETAFRQVEELLANSKNVTAIVAPSFPAEFLTSKADLVVGAIRRLGFKRVCEVAFGADIIARKYKETMDDPEAADFLASSCPAIVSYVEKFEPDLCSNISKYVSPMIAMARIVKEKYGQETPIVFIGPCIAKKAEIKREDSEGIVDLAITFSELKKMMREQNIDLDDQYRSEFDPPIGNIGASFAISGGSLQTAGVIEDIVEENVITITGKDNFPDAIKEFKDGYLNCKMLETLSCEGCIQGPGYSNEASSFRRRHIISKYIRKKLDRLDLEEWKENVEKYEKLDFSAKHVQQSVRDRSVSDEDVEKILTRIGKFSKKDQLNCGACGYISCREHAFAIANGLAEVEMCLPYTIDRLKETVVDLEHSYKEVKSIKEVLNHREKLASMGQLSAGIAHEVNNPLGVILMYSHLLLENEVVNDVMKSDIEMIVKQANRCKKIVSGLLQFSRQNKVIKTVVNLKNMINFCLDSIVLPKNVIVNIEAEDDSICAEIDKDQLSQVIINLVNNSVDAMEGMERPEVTVTVQRNGSNVEICVADTGSGIPEKFRKHVFDPFFTTKQMGKGTGLGLSVSYGIIKMHSGKIFVESNDNNDLGPTWTKITIQIPSGEGANLEVVS